MERLRDQDTESVVKHGMNLRSKAEISVTKSDKDSAKSSEDSVDSDKDSADSDKDSADSDKDSVESDEDSVESDEDSVESNEDIMKYGLRAQTELESNEESDSANYHSVSVLMEACSHGHYEMAKLLIDQGAEVNMQIEEQTALIKASHRGHADVVKLLIEKGAEVNMQGANGHLALLSAIHHGHHAVVELLIENGAQVNMQDNSGSSALLVASQGGHFKVAKLLIEKGADVNAQNSEYNDFPLLFASRKGHCDMAELLIENGANVNMQNIDGYFPLLIASECDNLNVVKLLIDKGAQVNMRDNKGLSALMVASENGCFSVIKLLIEKGAKVDLQDNDGRSALLMASIKGHCDIAKLLMEKGAKQHYSKNLKLSNTHQAGTSVQDNSNKATLEGLSSKKDITEQDHIPTSLSKESDNHYRKRGASFAPTEAPKPKHFKDNASTAVEVSCLTLEDLEERHKLPRKLLNQEVCEEHLLDVSTLLEDWKEFARAAGLTEPDVVAIDHDEKTVHGRRFKALHMWHQKKAFLATYSELARIMLRINKSDTAKKVCLLSEQALEKNVPATGTQLQEQNTDIERVTDDLVLFKNETIGSGAFGVVFRGEFNKQPCAIKVLRALADEIQLAYPISKYAREDSVSKFQKECEHLESFEHPNVVRHLATRKHPETNHLVLALELMDCNLRQYFTPQPGKDPVQLSLVIQTSLCLDIASALEYIHSRNVVHRDLCGDNILLACGGETPVAKVCDFGMSRILKSETHSISLQAFTHKGYMPPEATDLESSSYNTKFDIFSFGALMIQIVRHLPTIKDKKERGYELDLIEPSHPIKVLICESLCENRDNRPSATQLGRRLKLLVQYFAQ